MHDSRMFLIDMLKMNCAWAGPENFHPNNYLVHETGSFIEIKFLSIKLNAFISSLGVCFVPKDRYGICHCFVIIYLLIR